MNIVVVSISGYRSTFNVEPFDTIHSLRQKISDRKGIDADMLGLVYSNKRLINEKKLYDYSIQNNDVLYLIMISNHKGG